MRELPRGKVTFLFSDVEGSTRLLRELGDGYAEVLADHRRALREAFAARGGVEVDTQGDAFFTPSPTRRLRWTRRRQAPTHSREARSGCGWASIPVSPP